MVIKARHSGIPIPGTNIISYLFSDAKDLPDDPLWIDALDDRKSLSLASALVWTKRLAQGLDQHRVGPGEVVLVISPNHILVPAVFLGIVAGCRIFSGANPAFTADELCYQIRDLSARILLVHPALLNTARRAASKANLHESSIFIFADTEHAPIDNILDFRELLTSQEDSLNYQWPSFTESQSRSTVAAINYSSGTTGLPKGVMISHYNLIANISQQDYLSSIESPDVTDTPRWVGLLPLYHAYGQMFYISLAVKARAQVYIMQSFDFEAYLRTIQDRKITQLQLAPPLVVLLNKHPAVSKYDLSSVQQLGCGAAPLSASLSNAVSQRFSARLGQGWGMTEATCTGLSTPAGPDDEADLARSEGSVGMLIPNCEAKMLDEQGNEVKQGEPGELYYRGPNVCMGYWKNEKATEETILPGGWLRTGDVAVVNEKGWFWIVDRLKELIKVSGLQVAPAELEALLLTHQSVADAAVTGLSSEFTGQERVRAYIMLRPEAKGEVSEQDIVNWVGGQVPKHKRLTGGVVFVEAVPKSPSGKILRKVLREWAKRDIISEGGKARL